MSTILIKNAQIEGAIKDIFIKDNLICDIKKGINISVDKTIDAKGLLVLPSLFDMHVHLREPGYEYKEDILSGTRAAVKGGFGGLCCMPNTSPVADNCTVINYINSKAKAANYAKVYPIGAITKGSKGLELAEIASMKKEGIVAISDDGQPVENSQIMRLAMEYASDHNLFVISHCEDKNLVAGGLANEGYNATICGLKGNNRAAEEIMVSREIILAEVLNTQVHIAHISTKGSVQLIREAKARGVKVTAETCPHYIVLNDSIILDFDTNTKVNPPIRAESDRLAIIEGLIDGTIDCIVTDHAPHHKNEKNVEYQYALNGISGIETSFALCYTFLVKSGIISIERLTQLMYFNPKKILKLDNSGLKIGAVADIAIFDIDTQYAIDVNNFESKGHNSPFDGYRVFGKAIYNIIDGQIKLEDEVLI